MTNEQKKEMMAKAMEEIKTVADSGDINDMCTKFINAIIDFDVDSAVDSMVFMYDTFSAETFAVLGYFLDKASDKYQERLIEISYDDPDKLEKSEKISEIMDELIDEEDEEEP